MYKYLKIEGRVTEHWRWEGLAVRSIAVLSEEADQPQYYCTGNKGWSDCLFSYFNSLRSHTASLYFSRVHLCSPTVYSPTSMHSGHTQPLFPHSVTWSTHCVFSYYSALRSHTAPISPQCNLVYLLCILLLQCTQVTHCPYFPTV